MLVKEEEKQELQHSTNKLRWPHSPPIYDIEKSYLYNAEYGPFFRDAIEKRKLPEKEQWLDFLGFKVASPIGIPAGPLLNSKWIKLAADLGYDILCYKTIRSKEHPGHELPNMLYVDCCEQLTPGHLPDCLTIKKNPPSEMERVTVTNSFGMPSRSSEYLASDIPMAMQKLHPGQVMIVSVVGTAAGSDFNGFLDDFVAAAKQAKEYGAAIIEANFSCPNVAKGEGELYANPELVRKLTASLVKAIGDLPLIIKVGVFDHPKAMEQTLTAIAEGGARAVCGINTISMKVVKPAGLPALGIDRLRSGICGYPIRYAALEFTREARRIIEKQKLGLTLMSTGGALLPEHLKDFLDEGADIAMTATGMMWDPYLAARYRQLKGEGHA